MYPDACSLEPLRIADPKARAEALIEQLEKADAKRLITVNSITHVCTLISDRFD